MPPYSVPPYSVPHIQRIAAHTYGAMTDQELESIKNGPSGYDAILARDELNRRRREKRNEQSE